MSDSFSIPAANQLLAEGRDLSREQMRQVMRIIMSGEATPAQIGAFLIALTIKGESVDEIVGAATLMRELADKVETDKTDLADVVGTGGDGAKLFNISTAAAFVACAGGADMAKHGNRAATGNSGSADVLEAAGVNIALAPSQVGECIAQCGIGFMFAPTHHAATRHAIGPRKEIGVRSVFNLLGPLTNPAGATRQLVGVFAQNRVRQLAEVFGELGSRHAVVVCSDDHLDEISIAAPTQVAEYRDGEVTQYQITPQQFGVTPSPLGALVVDSPAQSLALMRQALGGERGAAFDMVALNAGAALYAADISESIADGVSLAREVLAGGRALEKLDQLAQFTSKLPRVV